MEHRRCLVTITDNIGPTSMPYNEFLLYRRKHFIDEKQILILLFKKKLSPGIEIPEDVSSYITGKSISLLRKTINQILREYSEVVFHIHEGKSVILFSLATFGSCHKNTIYTLHSTYRNYPFHNKLFSAIASILSKDVVCVSKTSLMYYPKWLKWLRGSHVGYIQNGVDTERIDSVDASIIEKNRPFTLIYVARLVGLKRHHILFEALKELPDVKLQLVGTGSLKEELKRKARDFGIEDRVEFYGLKPREQVYRMLKEADLYVSTSSYEGLPIGVLEALGCGTPCLVSDIEQHAEIAEKCPSLQLCSDDVGQWVQKIYCQKKLSKSDIAIIKHQNRISVKKYFSLATMHQHYNELYYKR